ncbi:MAG TPA: YihY/virulence factor BrkB family protein [Steroidobacteraceae bacterium]|nr:YihY/virulence factor BrkB family protein [Steroidobacteraceae bacterium]
MWNKVSQLLEHALFGPHTQGPEPLARLMRGLRYPYAILRDLLGGELTLRATGLVYTTLLAIIPAVALSFAVLKAFGAHRDMQPLLMEFFRPVGAAAPQLVDRLMDFAENVSGGLVGVLGLALLLWTLVGTVNKVEDSMNFVWRVDRARSMLRRVVEFAVLVTMGPLVVAIVIALSGLALDGIKGVTFEDFTLGQRALQLLISLAPFAIVPLLFTAMYMLMPNTRVRFVPALGGGLAAGVTWAALGKLFTAMVVYSSRLELVYAGFALVVAVFLWTYLGWLILLAGAQLAFYLQNPNYLRLGHAILRLSNDEKERLALDIMVRIASSHRLGDAPWSIERLSRALSLPGIAVADMANQLETSGLIARADDGKVFPAREISNITLTDVVLCARGRHAGARVPEHVSAPGVLELQQQMEQAWRDACGTRTLADLIGGR